MDIPRMLYRSLLALHPRGFRADFAEEMLWIFDESRDRTTRMLLDCLASLLRQHLHAAHYVQRPAAFATEINGFRMAPLQLAQASAAGIGILIMFLMGLAQVPPVAASPGTFHGPRVYQFHCEDLEPLPKETRHKAR